MGMNGAPPSSSFWPFSSSPPPPDQPAAEEPQQLPSRACHTFPMCICIFLPFDAHRHCRRPTCTHPSDSSPQTSRLMTPPWRTSTWPSTPQTTCPPAPASRRSSHRTGSGATLMSVVRPNVTPCETEDTKMHFREHDVIIGRRSLTLTTTLHSGCVRAVRRSGRPKSSVVREGSSPWIAQAPACDQAGVEGFSLFFSLFLTPVSPSPMPHSRSQSAHPLNFGTFPPRRCSRPRRPSSGTTARTRSTRRGRSLTISRYFHFPNGLDLRLSSFECSSNLLPCVD
ncbi:hypothetical protein B0H10DRAFT_764767 [Mycena sp. CBHHK59/15]|nr:hypothetical protein B0H10DRAFT_764767 [Mycena sp. CBHHK59/15]